jgi:5-methyltetrahydrofolate--homocysteine methyltransferase
MDVCIRVHQLGLKGNTHMSLFVEQLKKRVLFLDGAMGTSIHKLDLDLDRDYMGKENCTEVLLLTCPDAIQTIHEDFLKMGCDAVETDSFGSNKLVLAEYDLTDRCYELNKLAVEVARKACDNYSTPDKPRFVIGSVGPGTKLVTLGNTDWDTMLDSYTEQFLGLIDGGSDALLIETSQDLLQVKCAVNAALDALAQRGKTPATMDVDGDIPIMVQVTIETNGTMLLGTDIAAACTALEHYPILSIGMNCATGPTEMAQHIDWLGKHWSKAISVLPNAGLPAMVDGETVYPLQPEPFAKAVKQFVTEYGVNMVGGCCGTTPEHLKAVIDLVGDQAPVKVKKELPPSGCSSLYTPTDYRQDASILNIGERLNASGSRAFKRLLEAEDWDEMVSLAREQIREGSHVIDVNVDYAGRNNAADMSELVSCLVQQVNAPLMLDSTQPATIEAGLKRSGGKCLINSGNLEDGEEKFAVMCDLARRYNAGLVLGTIDEDPQEAMARTADRKLAIASRMFKLATEKYGLAAGDLMFDPLVLPISTGMEKDRRSGLETIEGTRRIAAAFPQCQITCGLSNISFGLKPAARQVLNSVFLYELQQAGMTSAIVHVSKILPKPRIDPKLWDAALDLIYDRKAASPVKLSDDSTTVEPLQIFIDMFPDDATTLSMKQDISELPLEERLQKHIIDGEKRGLVETLEAAREKYTPLEIINDHLLAGMKVVGELFGSGQMQLPFVLQSAEVMKMAVAHLEQFMQKVAGQTKGTIVLATVKGDVHDIGKNLVDIILTNNGYTVHNLGIKQPIDAILAKWKETNADAIGLSGLLVKSVNIMEDNIKEMVSQGINIPMLLGGAALSRHYCDCHLRSIYQGSGGKTYHGKDAFEGLRIMDHLAAGKLGDLEVEIEERLVKREASETKAAAAKEKKQAESDVLVATLPAKSAVATDIAVPKTPFLGSRVIEDIDLNEIYHFINRVALYRGQWQFKKGKLSDSDYEAMVQDKVDPIFDRLAKQCREEGILQPKVVYGYYPCQSNGDDLIIFDAKDQDKEINRFTFPRQASVKRQCISDFFRSVESGEKDVIGLSCVTVGDKASVASKKLFEVNEYQEYLYLHGFSVECAEGLAEFWHKRMRQELGIAGDDSPRIRDLFTQKYRGSRYSFGYPACPEMSDQDKLFALIDPSRIGCALTENWQIDPEQSTSAIIVHHPEAKYFNV